MKRCPKCKSFYEATAEFFPRNRSTKDGLATYCKICHNTTCREQVERNGGSRDYHLKRRYGLTGQQVAETLENQGNACAICHVPLEIGYSSVNQDHDHATNRPRGVLCRDCNLGLGNFRDNISFMESAISYLKVWQQE
jgi:nitrate/TMAO reductase-like tetraheme cytochrome c subunit